MAPKSKAAANEQSDAPPHGMFSGMFVFFVPKGVQARRLQVKSYSQNPLFIFNEYLFAIPKFASFYKFLSFPFLCVRFGSRGWCKWGLSLRTASPNRSLMFWLWTLIPFSQNWIATVCHVLKGFAFFFSFQLLTFCNLYVAEFTIVSMAMKKKRC